MGRKATYATLGPNFRIDIPKLLESKLLIQANSGGGKSYAVRKLLEQTHGHCQQIVIDPDGEFYTLREKFDYVLADPKSNECRADLKSAEKLAIRLLELGASAIIDIYELGTSKKLFVKKFCEALVNAPRELWHDVIIVIDEAHVFAPEGGKSDGCKDAVAALASLGRKRGFCVVLATQRIAKLDKDTAAEMNNKMIGRCAIDVDRKRAGDELGFIDKKQMLSLRTLEAGQFHVFGPAIGDEVKLITVGEVETTHLRAGKRTARKPAPSSKIKAVLAQLANIPHEADEEAKTVGDLKMQVAALKQELAKKPTVVATVEIPKAAPTIPAKILRDYEKTMMQWGKTFDRYVEQIGSAGDSMRALLDRGEGQLQAFKINVATVTTAIDRVVRPIEAKPMKAAPIVSVRNPIAAPKLKPITIANDNDNSDGSLPSGEAKILACVIHTGTAGILKRAITTVTGYKRPTRNAYIAKLRAKGFVTDENERVFATAEGIAALPDVEPLPTGSALAVHWLERLPTGEAAILRVAVDAYPNSIDKEEITRLTEYIRPTRNAYIAKLRGRELIDDERGAIKARSTLFD